MEERYLDKAKRAAKRERDMTIRQALRSTGKRPNRKDRKFDIDVEFTILERKAV